MSNFWIDQEIFQLLIHCFQMLIFVVIAVITISVGKLVTSVFFISRHTDKYDQDETINDLSLHCLGVISGVLGFS